MQTKRLLVMLAYAVAFLVSVNAQAPAPAPLPHYTCSAGISRLHGPSVDPCTNTTSYGDLGVCAQFMNGSEGLPSVSCCQSVLKVWTTYPACFCKVTFLSRFAEPGPVRAKARPLLCNIKDDLCTICPKYLNGAVTQPESSSVATNVIIGSLVAALVVIGSIVLVCFRKKIFRKYYQAREYDQQCHDIRNMEGKPTLYPYHVLRQATQNFNPKNKLGEGGFGSVFKGVLPDGTLVAVKQLSAKSQQGNDEFLNEVTLITSVQHRNLVQLRGCSLKGEERLLVYEYLQNKSLHQALFDTPRMTLDWKTRLKILEGTARGMAYLHEGCHTRIVHRDIKASNILLDKDLNPKIADFGLARIFSENDTHVSTRVAGTAGYLAPEYAMRGQLTEKADVFSFGIVSLELISGRANLDLHLDPDNAYLLDWAWQLHVEKNLMDLLDPVISWTRDDIEEAVRVVEVALLCTHSRSSVRPTMTSVVAMLTGTNDVVIPRMTSFDVRDYSNIDIKQPGKERAKPGLDSYVRSWPSLGAMSSSSNNNTSIVSALEPR